MSQNGLIELSARLGPAAQSEGKTRTNEPDPNDRYFVDLLSDARKSQKDGTTLTKRESYIQLLLNRVGFNHWEDWKEALRKSEQFLSPEAGFEMTGENAVTILIPRLLEKQLSPTLAIVKKSSSVDLLACREETLSELAKYALTQLEKSAIIMCALPLSWKDQVVKMRGPAWGEFSGTGRILPVWIDLQDEWNPVPPFIPSLKQEQSTAGLPGLLTGMLFLESEANRQPNAASQATGEGKGKQDSRRNAPHFTNSTVGFYMDGGTIHHLNTGGDQTINNYFD